eukprot:gb/GECG01003526.1/.p1 GENE.gb/GECG01003526.1/~~gb/GECG01003526.1/.p1  ORF type:complete len:2888 (+),score=233.66 gb/GECG01003526.1/:1-8664(+)
MGRLLPLVWLFFLELTILCAQCRGELPHTLLGKWRLTTRNSECVLLDLRSANQGIAKYCYDTPGANAGAACGRYIVNTTRVSPSGDESSQFPDFIVDFKDGRCIRIWNGNTGSFRATLPSRCDSPEPPTAFTVTNESCSKETQSARVGSTSSLLPRSLMTKWGVLQMDGYFISCYTVDFSTVEMGYIERCGNDEYAAQGSQCGRLTIGKVRILNAAYRDSRLYEIPVADYHKCLYVEQKGNGQFLCTAAMTCAPAKGRKAQLMLMGEGGCVDRRALSPIGVSAQSDFPSSLKKRWGLKDPRNPTWCATFDVGMIDTRSMEICNRTKQGGPAGRCHTLPVQSYGAVPETTEEWYRIKMNGVPTALQCMHILRKGDDYQTTGPRSCNFGQATNNELVPLRENGCAEILSPSSSPSSTPEPNGASDRLPSALPSALLEEWALVPVNASRAPCIAYLDMSDANASLIGYCNVSSGETGRDSCGNYSIESSTRGSYGYKVSIADMESDPCIFFESNGPGAYLSTGFVSCSANDQNSKLALIHANLCQSRLALPSPSPTSAPTESNEGIPSSYLNTWKLATDPCRWVHLKNIDQRKVTECVLNTESQRIACTAHDLINSTKSEIDEHVGYRLTLRSATPNVHNCLFISLESGDNVASSVISCADLDNSPTIVEIESGRCILNGKPAVQPSIEMPANIEAPEKSERLPDLMHYWKISGTPEASCMSLDLTNITSNLVKCSVQMGGDQPARDVCEKFPVNSLESVPLGKKHWMRISVGIRTSDGLSNDCFFARTEETLLKIFRRECAVRTPPEDVTSMTVGICHDRNPPTTSSLPANGSLLRELRQRWAVRSPTVMGNATCRSLDLSRFPQRVQECKQEGSGKEHHLCNDYLVQDVEAVLAPTGVQWYQVWVQTPTQEPRAEKNQNQQCLFLSASGDILLATTLAHCGLDQHKLRDKAATMQEGACLVKHEEATGLVSACEISRSDCGALSFSRIPTFDKITYFASNPAINLLVESSDGEEPIIEVLCRDDTQSGCEQGSTMPLHSSAFKLLNASCRGNGDRSLCRQYEYSVRFVLSLNVWQVVGTQVSPNVHSRRLSEEMSAIEIPVESRIRLGGRVFLSAAQNVQIQMDRRASGKLSQPSETRFVDVSPRTATLSFHREAGYQGSISEPFSLAMEPNVRAKWHVAEEYSSFVLLPEDQASGSASGVTMVDMNVSILIHRAPAGHTVVPVNVTFLTLDEQVIERITISLTLRVRQPVAVVNTTFVDVQQGVTDTSCRRYIRLENLGSADLTWDAKLAMDAANATQPAPWLEIGNVSKFRIPPIGHVDIPLTLIPRNKAYAKTVSAWIRLSTNSWSDSGISGDLGHTRGPSDRRVSGNFSIRVRHRTVSLVMCSDPRAPLTLSPSDERSSALTVSNTERGRIVVEITRVQLRYRSSNESLYTKLVDRNTVLHLSDWLQIVPRWNELSTGTSKKMRVILKYSGRLAEVLYKSSMKTGEFDLRITLCASLRGRRSVSIPHDYDIHFRTLGGLAEPKRSKIKLNRLTGLVGETVVGSLVLRDRFGVGSGYATWRLQREDGLSLRAFTDKEEDEDEVQLMIPEDTVPGERVNSFRFHLRAFAEANVSIVGTLGGESIVNSPTRLTIQGISCPPDVEVQIERMCYCRRGYRRTRSGYCEACPSGTFQPDPSNELGCNPCPPNSFSTSGSDRCLPCPRIDGVACRRGQLRMSEGYWCEDCPSKWKSVSSTADILSGAQEAVFHECNPPHACKVNGSAFASDCAGGYVGPVCSQCSPDYAKASDESCRPCWSSGVNALLLMLSVILVLGGVGGLAYRVYGYDKAVFRQLKEGKQSRNGIVEHWGKVKHLYIHDTWVREEDMANNDEESDFPKLTASAVLKNNRSLIRGASLQHIVLMILDYLQMSAILNTMKVAPFFGNSGWFGEVADLATFSPFRLPYFHCLTGLGHFESSLLTMLIRAMYIAFVTTLHIIFEFVARLLSGASERRKHSAARIRQRLYRAVLVHFLFLSLFYMAVCESAFRSLRVYPKEIGSSERSLVDLTMSTDSSEFLGLKVTAIVVLVLFGLLFPFLQALWFGWRFSALTGVLHGRLLWNLAGSYSLRTHGFYWGVVVMVRKLALVAISVWASTEYAQFAMTLLVLVGSCIVAAATFPHLTAVSQQLQYGLVLFSTANVSLGLLRDTEERSSAPYSQSNIVHIINVLQIVVAILVAFACGSMYPELVNSCYRAIGKEGIELTQSKRRQSNFNPLRNERPSRFVAPQNPLLSSSGSENRDQSSDSSNRKASFAPEVLKAFYNTASESGSRASHHKDSSKQQKKVSFPPNPNEGRSSSLRASQMLSNPLGFGETEESHHRHEEKDGVGTQSWEEFDEAPSGDRSHDVQSVETDNSLSATDMHSNPLLFRSGERSDDGSKRSASSCGMDARRAETLEPFNRTKGASIGQREYFNEQITTETSKPGQTPSVAHHRASFTLHDNPLALSYPSDARTFSASKGTSASAGTDADLRKRAETLEPFNRRKGVPAGQHRHTEEAKDAIPSCARQSGGASSKVTHRPSLTFHDNPLAQSKPGHADTRSISLSKTTTSSSRNEERGDIRKRAETLEPFNRTTRRGKERKDGEHTSTMEAKDVSRMVDRRALTVDHKSRAPSSPSESHSGSTADRFRTPISGEISVVQTTAGNLPADGKRRSVTTGHRPSTLESADYVNSTLRQMNRHPQQNFKRDASHKSSGKRGGSYGARRHRASGSRIHRNSLKLHDNPLVCSSQGHDAEDESKDNASRSRTLTSLAKRLVPHSTSKATEGSAGEEGPRSATLSGKGSRNDRRGNDGEHEDLQERTKTARYYFSRKPTEHHVRSKSSGKRESLTDKVVNSRAKFKAKMKTEFGQKGT